MTNKPLLAALGGAIAIAVLSTDAAAQFKSGTLTVPLYVTVATTSRFTTTVSCRS
jgi:hypothetical protein